MQPKSHFRLLRIYGHLAKWLHPSELQATLLWAVLVGCVGGLSAILFRRAIQGILWLFTRHTCSLEQVAEVIPGWQRLVIPALGGWLAGWVLHFGACFRWGHRSTDYMEAVAVHQGTLSSRQGLTKALSSLLTIGSGGSIGREGAMVQISAMFSSWMGTLGKLSTPRLRWGSPAVRQRICLRRWCHNSIGV